MKKHLFQKSLLVLIGVLIVGVNQMWANNEYGKRYLYINASNNHSYTDASAQPALDGYWDYACTDKNSTNFVEEANVISTYIWYFDLKDVSDGSYSSLRGFGVQRHPLNTSNYWNNTTRGVVDGSNDNCLWVNKDNLGFTWGTYAPPMESVTITNTSTVFGGDGSAGNPYKINKGSTITVSASSTSTVPGDAMTKYYEFYYKQGSGAQTTWQSSSTTTTSPSLTASSTAGVTYEIEVKAQNEYYSYYGDKASNKMYFVTIEPIYAILGDFNSWDRSAATWDLSDQGSSNWDASFTLTAGSYGFKVVYNSSHYGKNSTTISRASASANSLVVGQSNITITADYTGTYRFRFNSSSKNLTVTFPTIRQVNYSIVTSGSGTGTAGSLSAEDDDDDDRAVSNGGYVTDGHSVTFIAPSAKSGYEFKGWYSTSTPDPSNWATNRLTTNKNYTVTVSGAAKTVYAVYYEKTYTVNVSAAGEHGSITTGSPSVTAGVATNPTITAATSGANKDQYRFWKWTWTGDASVANAYSATTTVSATGTGTVTALFVSVWCIKGGDSKDPDSDNDEMGDWAVCNSLDYQSSGKYEGSIYLLGGTTYQFKVMDFPNTAYYGYGTASDYDMAFVGQTGEQTTYNNSGSDHNIRLMTAGTGWYTFQWSSTPHNLKVLFPDVTHPSVDYVYFDDDANWNGTQGGVLVHLTGGTTTGSNSMPYAGSCTIAGHTYYYSALGNNTSVRFSGKNNVASYTTGNVSASSNKGKYYDQGTSTWKSFTFSITYKDQGNVDFSGSQTSPPATHTFGTATTLKIPTKAGYNFGGWFTSIDCTTGAVGNTTSASLGATAVTNNITLYAKWTPKTLTYSTGGNWNASANWTESCIPTIEHDVIINAPVDVNITNAVAKSVKIYNDGNTHTGKLTIDAGKALVVAEDIKKTTDGSTKIATTADVLHIEAGDAETGNGALVWGTEGTPGAAQVDFYTKSHGSKNSSDAINQYIGTPFSNDQQILYQFYYSWMFKIARSAGAPYWTQMGESECMNEWEGYNLITGYDAGTVYQMDGTLVSNANVTLNGSSTPALVYSGSGTGASANNENVLANSWVAPIKINLMDVSNNFTNVEGSIYIFNAGSAKQGSGGFTEGTAGNYTCYTVGTAGENVIPSMQSFSVFTRGASPSLTLNYAASVKTPVAAGVMNSANKAPSRNTADEMELLKVRVQGENGWADELKMYIHEDFSDEFENGWDGHKLFGYPQAPQLYAVSNDGELAVVCAPTADNKVLGFTPGSEDNVYTFSFAYDGTEELYLRDTKTNAETLISSDNSYIFTSESSDSDMRFIIIKKNTGAATGVDEIISNETGVQKIMHNGALYIVREGRIYNVTGALVK